MTTIDSKTLNAAKALVTLFSRMSDWSWKEDCMFFEMNIAGEYEVMFSVAEWGALDTVDAIDKFLNYIDENFPRCSDHYFLSWVHGRREIITLRKGIDPVKFEVGDAVLYVPDHANGNEDHPDCERGVVSSIRENGNGTQLIWVRFKGPDGESTPAKNLIKL